ncbi:LacI family DNA-binding transcriptional regulator [Saccharomonospora saliphila]|uniref:LacI family DNA-binding transcriptional regulator n=1 Tax=Saccharomonospora saliphila TaxID=369829 RepID=UPI000367EF8B|nr:LacI family DNA-binding transcriptional regulator [Saccharomonospora saliphila]
MSKVTLREVAARARVSVSTVSLVLNDRDGGRVKPALSRRVRAAAEELGYAPNLLARGLRTSRTQTIGLISDRVASTPFAGRMLAGAQNAAWETGRLLLLVDSGGDVEMEQEAVGALVQRNVDALIYASMYHREVELPAVPAALPLVVLDARPAEDGPDVSWVVPDEEGGARAAVSALLDAGHTRIGYCTDTADVPAVHARLRSYRETLAERGVRPEPGLVSEVDGSDAEEGRRSAARLLSSPEPPTALFCYNDRMAMGAYRAAREFGLRIPEDLSVVGFDDQEHVADGLAPGLTTVALPHYEMGEWAARRVLEHLSGEAGVVTRHQRMPCPLVPRESVASPRVMRS